MPYPDTFILMVMGGGFLGAGIGVLLWGKKVEKRYYDSLATRRDLREFMERSPQRPGHSSTKIGGLIAIILGIVMLGIGGGLRIWG